MKRIMIKGLSGWAEVTWLSHRENGNSMNAGNEALVRKLPLAPGKEIAPVNTFLISPYTLEI